MVSKARAHYSCTTSPKNTLQISSISAINQNGNRQTALMTVIDTAETKGAVLVRAAQNVAAVALERPAANKGSKVCCHEQVQ